MASKSSSDRPGNVKESATDGNLQMGPELMRELAHTATDLLIARIENLPNNDAWDGEFRQGLAEKLLESAPEEGRSGKEVIEQAARDILPLSLSLDHPRCFGFVPSQPTWPGVIADFMAAGFNINQSSWLISSGASQLELVVIDWFRDWLGYPESAGGILTSGGSAAAVNALFAAREDAGLPERACVYMSDQSHRVQYRAARIIGINPDNIRVMPTDKQFRLDLESLRRNVSEDRESGLVPMAVCANAGTGSTGAVDPLNAMADYCESEDIWLHVDAAYGGFAILAEEGQRVLRGIERADSIGLDAHKWLFQPYEVGGLMVKDLGTLERAFGIKADILQDTIWGANHPNFSDRGLQLSRSVRALKIWMSIQTFGMAAFREAISNALLFANRIEGYVNESPLLEMLAPVELGIACFRVNPYDRNLDEESLEELNRAVLARMFWEDRAFISSTSLHGKFALRMCVINYGTTWDDVNKTMEAILKFGREALER